MAILNFPPTAGEPIDGSFTYSSDGVTYSWDGYKWTADTGSGSGGDANHNDGPTPPTTGELADQWYNTDDGRLYTYTADSSGALVWIDASPDSIAGGSGGGGGGTTVNYNGASAWGNVAADGTINGALNVASVTKTVTGTYSVVFTTPMPNNNYAVSGSINGNISNGTPLVFKYGEVTTTGFTVATCYTQLTSGAPSQLLANLDFTFAVHSENAIAPQSGVGADAWARVDGDASIFSSYNVANDGVVKTGTGKYRVSFITPMPTSNYSAIVTPQQSNKVNAVVPKSSMDENGFEVYIFDNSNGDFFDCAFAATVHASSTVTPTYTWTRDGTTLKPANDGDDVEVDGSITAAGGDIKLRNDASSVFERTFSVNRDIKTTISAGFSDNTTGLAITDNLSDTTDDANIKLRSDGSGSFAQPVVFGNDPLVANNGVRIANSGGIITRRDTGTNNNPCFAALQGGGNTTADAVIRMNFDGSSTFAGNMQIGTIDQSSTTTTGVHLNKVGVLKAQRSASSDSNSNIIAAYKGSSVVWSVNGNGASSFTSNVTVPNVIFNLEPDNSVNYTATMVDGEETQVYNGPTLDVKALLLTLQTAATRIATLEAKVATLESDHTTLMNNNNNNGGGY